MNVMKGHAEDFFRRKEEYDRKEAEFQRLRLQRFECFMREAWKVVDDVLDRHALKGKYEVPEQAAPTIAYFLMNSYSNDAKARLPEGIWDKVIEMYMGLVDPDIDFMDEVHRFLALRD